MSESALTHHEIVRLVEPFARQGRHVDLAASDRVARRIAFKARDLPSPPPGISAWREVLELDCSREERFVLLRTVTAEADSKTHLPTSLQASSQASLQANLQASGPDPAELLARVDSVAPQQHFSFGAGFAVARSYDTSLPSGVRANLAPGTVPLVLTKAQLQVEGLVLELIIKLPGLRSVAADLTLTPAPVQQPEQPELPEDLLAVQGWDWARLIRSKTGWTSKLRLRGNVLRRSRTAEAALDRAGAHLARVLAQPPAAFHDQHLLARWGVVLRRGIPTLTALGMVGGALLLPYITDAANSGMWLALQYVPIALLALSFSLQELPQFEIPPWPRRSRAQRWWSDGSRS